MKTNDFQTFQTFQGTNVLFEQRYVEDPDISGILRSLQVPETVYQGFSNPFSNPFSNHLFFFVLIFSITLASMDTVKRNLETKEPVIVT